MDTKAPSPTPPSERIFALDTIRGFAVLGILLMNILGMGLSMPAYLVPSAEIGGMQGANLWAWIAEMMYFEGTMRGLFTILFGAGVILYTSRLERAGLGLRTADYFFRRNLWLIVFGLFNGWILLWTGDILFVYGMTALFLFVFRNLPVRKLFLGAALVLCIQPIGGYFEYQEFVSTKQEGSALLALEQANADLTDQQAETLHDYRHGEELSHPDVEKVEKASVKMRTSYGTAAAKVRAKVAENETTHYFTGQGMGETLGMMLLGMALFKSGALTLGWSTRAYAIMLVVGYGFGLGVNAWEVNHVISNNFESSAVLLPWTLTYDLGRIPVTLGHVALAMLVVRSGMFRGVLSWFAATGQMALTNYLAQSAIALVLFTGLGFGLFNQLERYQLYYIVFAIWAVELAWSPWWLARYQFGPVEWLWRSLTRWELQPMRRVAAIDAEPAAA
ncbi:DUF418 domain-containing protein [soil metagenome]